MNLTGTVSHSRVRRGHRLGSLGFLLGLASVIGEGWLTWWLFTHTLGDHPESAVAVTVGIPIGLGVAGAAGLTAFCLGALGLVRSRRERGWRGISITAMLLGTVGLVLAGVVAAHIPGWLLSL